MKLERISCLLGQSKLEGGHQHGWGPLGPLVQPAGGCCCWVDPWGWLPGVVVLQVCVDVGVRACVLQSELMQKCVAWWLERSGARHAGRLGAAGRAAIDLGHCTLRLARLPLYEP